MTGICDSEDFSAKFRSIVEPINSDNDLDGIVVSYRLFPNSVACLNEPSGVSTEHFKVEDFPHGEEKGSAESSWGFDAANSANPFVRLRGLSSDFCFSFESWSSFAHHRIFPSTSGTR